MQTTKTQSTEIYAVTRKSEIPTTAFEDTAEGRALWNKLVRLHRVIVHDGQIEDVEAQIVASVYALCLDSKYTQIWIKKDARSAMMYRADRPANYGTPTTATEKAAALARGEVA